MYRKLKKPSWELILFGFLVTAFAIFVMLLRITFQKFRRHW